jgi:hypothetical protein
MPLTLKLSSGPSLLETAFHASKGKDGVPTLSKDMSVEWYNQLFTPLPGAVQAGPFERFSLTDPNVHTFLTSTTSSAI